MILSLSFALGVAMTPVIGTAVAATPRPNVVILISDDQRWDTIGPQFTPQIWGNLVNPGARFPASSATLFHNAFVPNPLCCPSRASTLTGRYSHTTGVYTNYGPYGGFEAFDDKHTIATDFNAAGYRTAMVGKYLNGYATTNDYVPPGWDRWFAVGTGAYYNYTAQSNGRQVRYGSDPSDYVTRVLADKAAAFVQNSVQGGDPFFLYAAFTAPHGPAVPDPRDVGRFASVPLPQPPSYNVSEDPTGAGKPDFILAQSPRDPTEVHERQLESAYGVDRAVGRLLSVLPSNTIVVYLSDNGFLWGEHRWVGKSVPYNESIRVPMILASLDGSFTLPDAWTQEDIVLNVDLRPTLETAAGVPLSTSVDGLDWEHDAPRSVFVLEHGGDVGTPTFCGAREKNWMYVRYRDGFEELYDEVADPYEMENLATDPIDPGGESAYDRLTTEAETLCRPEPPGPALPPPARVVGGPEDQRSAFGNAIWRTWTGNSVARPNHYDAYGVHVGTPGRVRLNAPDTGGDAGNLLPATNTAIYTQSTTSGSDLYFFNLDTRVRRKVPGVNTRRNEHNSIASSGYVLFDRDRTVDGVLYTDLLLFDRVGRTTVRLGRWRSGRVRVIPGSIGEAFASYTLVKRITRLAYVYDIGSAAHTEIAAPDGFAAYAPAVDEAASVVYYFRGSTAGCGLNQSIRRIPLAGGTQTVLTVLPLGTEATGLSIAPGGSGHTDLLFSRHGCDDPQGDIYILAGVDRV